MRRTESPRKDAGEVCSSLLSHRVYIWGPGLFTEPQEVEEITTESEGLELLLHWGQDTLPTTVPTGSGTARAEACCRGTHTSSCGTWERQGQRMWGGADKEQLLPSHRADGRPKDRYPIHFILGTIQVHLVCSHIARYSHESEQAKGQPQGLPVLSASLFFPTVGVHATIRSWSGMRLPAHQSTLQRLGIAGMSRDLPMLESSHPWCGNSNTCSLDNI